MNEFKIKKGLIVSGSTQLSGSVNFHYPEIPEDNNEDTVLVL